MNEQEIELKIALEDIERQRDLVDRKLVDVMQVVDALKNQVP
jgi:hypothetical protein